MFRQTLYRIKQTVQALAAPFCTVDDDLAAQQLTPALYRLYLTMSKNDRQHHLRVYRRLRDTGHENRSLLTAALLHDVGKTRYRFGVIERVLAVAIKTIAPQQFAKWSASEPQGWRRALVVSAMHPEWGAEMVAEVTDDRLAVELIRLHQTPVSEDLPEASRILLLALQAADDVS